MRFPRCALWAALAALVAFPAHAGQCSAPVAAERHSGSDHVELSAVLGPQAQPRPEDANPDAALASRRQALETAIRSCGTGSLAAAEAMTALASLYIDLQRYLDAEPLLIAAGNATPEADDAVTMAVLVGRARIALARGQAAEAQRLAERAAEGEGAVSTQRRTAALRVLGGALAVEDKFAKAEAALRRALDLDREIEGDGGLATARSSAALGNVLLRQKRYPEALPLIEDAARIDRSRLGPNHPYIADDFHDIGVVYLETGRPRDAVKALRYAIDLLERGGGRDTPRFAYLEMTLARTETRLGHKDAAKALFDDASRVLGAAEREERAREGEA